MFSTHRERQDHWIDERDDHHAGEDDPPMAVVTLSRGRWAVVIRKGKTKRILAQFQDELEARLHAKSVAQVLERKWKREIHRRRQQRGAWNRKSVKHAHMVNVLRRQPLQWMLQESDAAHGGNTAAVSWATGHQHSSKNEKGETQMLIEPRRDEQCKTKIHDDARDIIDKAEQQQHLQQTGLTADSSPTLTMSPIRAFTDKQTHTMQQCQRQRASVEGTRMSRGGREAEVESGLKKPYISPMQSTASRQLRHDLKRRERIKHLGSPEPKRRPFQQELQVYWQNPRPRVCVYKDSDVGLSYSHSSAQLHENSFHAKQFSAKSMNRHTHHHTSAGSGAQEGYSHGSLERIFATNPCMPSFPLRDGMFSIRDTLFERAGRSLVQSQPKRWQ